MVSRESPVLKMELGVGSWENPCRTMEGGLTFAALVSKMARSVGVVCSNQSHDISWSVSSELVKQWERSRCARDRSLRQFPIPNYESKKSRRIRSREDKFNSLEHRLVVSPMTIDVTRSILRSIHPIVVIRTRALIQTLASPRSNGVEVRIGRRVGGDVSDR